MKFIVFTKYHKLNVVYANIDEIAVHKINIVLNI